MLCGNEANMDGSTSQIIQERRHPRRPRGVCESHIVGRALASKIAKMLAVCSHSQNPTRTITLDYVTMTLPQVGLFPTSSGTNKIPDHGSGLLHKVNRGKVDRHYLD
ncbi:hypothetical protein CR513_55159, partial [Mucuna pruriens]